jgi:hypothetical protein
MMNAVIDLDRTLRGRLDPSQPEVDDVEQLLDDTYDPDPKVRKWAVHNLCPCEVKKNIPPVWDRLVAMVADEDPKVRGQVIHNLCDGSPRGREAQIVGAIEGLYHDPDPGVRRKVRHVLARYRRSGRINTL